MIVRRTFIKSVSMATIGLVGRAKPNRFRIPPARKPPNSRRQQALATVITTSMTPRDFRQYSLVGR
jgi:hypothetical protein